MKRFHNPMTKFMIVILSICLVTAACLFIFVDNIPSAVYVIILCTFLVLTLITALGEYKFRKSDAKLSEETGEEYNTAEYTADLIKREPKKTLVLSIVIIIAILGGFVALCMYNALIGVPIFVLFCLVLLLYPLYKSKKITTVEKYISSKNSTIRPLLQKIHEQILEVSPDIMPIIDSTTIFPTYAYIKDIERLEMYHLISIQAIIGGKSICIYPHNPEVFSVFTDRLTDYKNNGNTEIFIPANKPLDCDLLRDIVKFNIEQINTI